MMRKHLTIEVIARLQRGELQPGEVADALRHIGACDECAARMRSDVAAQIARVQELLANEALEPRPHLAPEDLFAYVDGSATAETRAHVEECDVCRDDARDLRSLRVPHARRRWIWLAAAAAVAVTLLIPLMRLQHETTTAPTRVVPASGVSAPAQRYPNAEWTRLVDETRASGRLPVAGDLAELRGGRETLRGDGEAAFSLQPRGIVIDTTMPSFTWSPLAGATYVVAIFDGDEEVARTESLETTRWRPGVALRRGRTYAWQIEAKTAKELVILPSPPDPPARFRIISAEQHEELAAALRLYPEDHLLLAALYARAGLEREANEHFRLVAPRLR